MKTKITKISALLLAALMLVGTATACAESNDPAETNAPNAESKAETSGNAPAQTTPQNPADSSDEGNAPAQTTPQTPAESEGDALSDALEALGSIDFGGRRLGVVYAGFENEIKAEKGVVDADGGTAQVINDAVYLRNKELEDLCKLVFTPIKADNIADAVQKENMSSTGDFQFIDAPLTTTATSFATSAYLADWNQLGIDLEGPWWDSGTADFVLNGGVYFMSGALNFADDNLTYVLIFNKDMRNDYANTVPNPYTTVRNKEWTLAYFNNIIQGISSESSGNGQWDENDTYGFITTWEYGNTFFLGSGLRYVINDESVDFPKLFLSEQSNMDKALQVLDLAQSIYHDNNASFMSPPGKENLGLTAFQENRGLFYAEVVSYITELNRSMKGDYGIVPVPKYDKEQEHYNTWTHESGSTFSIISTIPDQDEEIIGQIMSAYALLSYKHVKPAYYDTVLTTRNMRDPDSAEMMDIIFANRVYDMGFYFQSLNCYSVFKTCVNEDADNFSSSYKGVDKRFDREMKKILSKLGD